MSSLSKSPRIRRVEELEGHLERSGINVGKECERGALKLGTRRNGVSRMNYLRRGKLVRFWTLSTKLPSRVKGSRFAVEMTRALGPEISADQLEH